MKRLFACWVLTWVLLVAWGQAPVQADDVYTIVVKKQEQKAKTRWTLADWLETRDRMRLMDLWLAMHSPSPYEFFLTGEYRFASSTPYLDSFNHLRGGIGAYASIFGLEVDTLHSNRAETFYLFCLRVFGFHTQGTNITLQGGVLTESSPSHSRNPVVGARATFYLNRFFGVEAGWRHLFDSTPNVSGTTRNGNRYAYGGFIDFRFLRIYGEYFRSTEVDTPSGIGAGFKFFF